MGALAQDITTVFYARADSAFIEKKGDLRRKKLQTANQGSSFLQSILGTEET